MNYLFNHHNEIVATVGDEELYTKNLRRASRRAEKKVKDPHKYPAKATKQSLYRPKKSCFFRGMYPTEITHNCIVILKSENLPADIPEEVQDVMNISFLIWEDLPEIF